MPRKTHTPTVHDRLSFMRDMMPLGSAEMFEVRRFGNYYGCKIECMYCEYVPPPGYNYVKWRNLCAHVAVAHKGKPKPKPKRKHTRKGARKRK